MTEQELVNNHWHLQKGFSTAGSASYFSGLELCGFRRGSFHRGGHYGRLHRLLLRLLWTWYPERRQRIDPIPATSETEKTQLRDKSRKNCTRRLCTFSISYLTSSKNLSSSRAGNCESLKKSKEKEVNG